MHGGMRRVVPVLGLLSVLQLSGCVAAALTAGGVAGGAGINHTLNGVVYKTFTTPVKDLRVATLKTLNRMQMKVNSDKKAEFGWQINASAFERTIDIELERLTPVTTRMRVDTSKDTFFKDSATSTEIILQTAQIVENGNKARR
jgi:hypothetical protein